MSKTTTTAKIRSDGSIVEVLADGSERPFPDRSMRPMTEAEIAAAAVADPDARPMTAEELIIAVLGAAAVSVSALARAGKTSVRAV